jgi:hypothetical protein
LGKEPQEQDDLTYEQQLRNVGEFIVKAFSSGRSEEVCTELLVALSGCNS